MLSGQSVTSIIMSTPGDPSTRLFMLLEALH